MELIERLKNSANDNASTLRLDQFGNEKNSNNNNNSNVSTNTNSVSGSDSDLSSNEITSNLIVNYLPQNLSSDELKRIFQSIGSIENCKLIKDKNTGQSLCFGFVNYFNIEDAEKAVKTLNGLKIENKIIKVSYARPSCESIKGANLYICGLPKSWTLDHMNQYFSTCGKIITSRILFNLTNGQSKGVGFIRFDKKSEADLAIDKLNGTIPEGSQEPITVKFANFPTSLNSKFLSTINSSQINNLSINTNGYLSSNSNAKLNPNQSLQTAAALASIRSGSNNNSQLLTSLNQFSSRYSIYSNDFMCNDNIIPTTSTTTTNSTTNTIGSISSGLSYVNQHQLTTANQLPSMNVNNLTQSLSNNCLTSSLNSCIGSTSGWCIFIYNLSPETEDSLLWQLFGPFGAVQNVKVIRDYQSQKCKGYGFVTMTNYDDAIIAINSLNGISIGNRILQISFKTNKNTLI